ncbi:MAG TPA: diaminopimelate decarboxylase [Ktedonobacterales bacterium]|jgi:diaminopimelate decarboxylase
MIHTHLWPDTIAVDEVGRLSVAGVPLASLAREYGTPLYLFDEATIRSQCRAFRRAFASRWTQSAIAYASKAYLSPALCQILLQEGLELDVVSAGEWGLALAAGYPVARMHLHGNFKPEAELKAALEVGLGRIVVDSLEEMEQIESWAARRQQRVSLWLRLCPDVPVQTHRHLQTGHAASKFGLPLANGSAAKVVARASVSPWLDLVGLHAHVGSHLSDLEPLAQALWALGDFAAAMGESYGITVREISPGGGLGVASLPEEQSPDIEIYAETLTTTLRQVVEQRGLSPPRLVVEPGRAIVARAGIALYTVGPRKVLADGSVVLAVDGGMGDNVRPALYGAAYHAVLAERVTVPATEQVRVVGRYCESGDTLIEQVALPPAEAGEVLAIPVSGAYHLPLASNYNMVPRPAVVFLREGSARLVRRRETLEDMLRLDLLAT